MTCLFISSSQGNSFLLVLLLFSCSASSVAIAYFSAWIIFGSASLLQQQLEQLGPQDDEHNKWKGADEDESYGCFLFFGLININVTLSFPLAGTAFYVADAGVEAIVILMVMGACLATTIVGYRVAFGLPLHASSLHRTTIQRTEGNEVNEDKLFEL